MYQSPNLATLKKGTPHSKHFPLLPLWVAWLLQHKSIYNNNTDITQRNITHISSARKPACTAHARARTGHQRWRCLPVPARLPCCSSSPVRLPRTSKIGGKKEVGAEFRGKPRGRRTHFLWLAKNKKNALKNSCQNFNFVICAFSKCLYRFKTQTILKKNDNHKQL